MSFGLGEALSEPEDRTLSNLLQKDCALRFRCTSFSVENSQYTP